MGNVDTDAAGGSKRRFSFFKKVAFLLLALCLVTSMVGAFDQMDVKAASKEGYVNHSFLRLREKKSVESRVVEILDRHDKLEILEEDSEWYKVIATHKNKKLNGYVAKQYVKIAQTKPADTKTESKTETKAETSVGKVGYVNKKADFLNVRKGPGVKYGIITALDVYDTMNVVNKQSNGWLKVTFKKNGKSYTGYVNGSYVTMGNPPKAPAKETTKAPAKKETTKAPAKETTKATTTKKETASVKPGKSNGKVIYLTFDDGPGPYTKQLLDVLDKYNVKATFFVTNQFPKYQNMIGEEAKRGHTVALHSYTHDYKTIYSNVDGYFNDIDKMQAILKKQGVKKSDLIRFPGGSSNKVSIKYNKGIMTKLTKEVVKRGYNYSDWNVTSGDAGETKSTAQIIKNIENGCAKHKVSVVLQHDIKSYSVAAVEEVIRWGIKNGYTFKAMTKDTVVKHGRLNN